jgi:DeoR/GlpR family transcriptional regulator of sugar metabolism
MLTRQRKHHILAVLARDGQVVARALSQELAVSEDTVRRDLRELAGEGALQRVHGGALPASPATVALAEREQLAPDEKQALGRAAAALVEPGHVVFVDGGTTALQMVRALPPDLRATVVTHSPLVAAELVAHRSIELVLIGGRVFKHSGVAVGAAAAQAIREVRADTYFMGVTGLHVERGLSTGDLEEAHIKRALLESAAETVVLLTADKLGVASPYVIAPVSAVTTVLIGGEVPDARLAAIRRLGVAVRVASVRRPPVGRPGPGPHSHSGKRAAAATGRKRK